MVMNVVCFILSYDTIQLLNLMLMPRPCRLWNIQSYQKWSQTLERLGWNLLISLPLGRPYLSYRHLIQRDFIALSFPAHVA